jgi:hypothetical protein
MTPPARDSRCGYINIAARQALKPKSTLTSKVEAKGDFGAKPKSLNTTLIEYLQKKRRVPFVKNLDFSLIGMLAIERYNLFRSSKSGS